MDGILEPKPTVSLARTVLEIPNIGFATVLSALMLWGICTACRTRHVAAIPYALLILGFPIVYYITHPDMDKRHAIDPQIIVLGIYAVMHWVEGRRRVSEEHAKERAEQAHAQLAAIVESSNDAIYSMTLDGIVTTWNRAAERMFGYRAEEIVGKPASILFPPDRIQELEPVLNLIRQGKAVPLHNSARVAKDGRVLSVDTTISPIRDAQGKVIGASSIARDLMQPEDGGASRAQRREAGSRGTDGGCGRARDQRPS